MGGGKCRLLTSYEGKEILSARYYRSVCPGTNEELALGGLMRRGKSAFKESGVPCMVEHGLDLRSDLSTENCSSALVNHLTIPEERQQWYAHDMVLDSHLAALIYVGLAKVEAALISLCEFFGGGSDHSARLAPACPEVYHDGQVTSC